MLEQTATEVDGQLPGGGQTGNHQILKAYIIEPQIQKDTAAEAKLPATKELPPDDILNSLSADGRMLIPPHDKLVLSIIPENSSCLLPVIQAMAQNVDGFGHHLEARVNIEAAEVTDEMKKAVLAERSMLVNFFRNCCADYSFTEMRRRTRTDIETTGEGFTEVIRVPATGEIVQLNHIPSYQIMLGAQDLDLTVYDRKVPKMDPDGTIELESLRSRKRFRKFIQTRIASVWSRGATFHRGTEIRWFKEFGDPRVISNKTGYVIDKADELAAIKEEDKANELIHWKIYSPRTPYGMPRYIGNLITLFGDRGADEINYATLRNNNVPSMMLMVSNGQLTQASIERIQQFVNSQIAGQNNYSKFLLIEAETQYEGQEAGIPKIAVEKLANQQNKDQLFQEYSKNNRDKVRECWRIPPIFMGRSEEITRSTAEASRKIADEQVFSPEREEFDNWINQHLMPQMGVVYHSFVSNGPNVTDDQDLIAVMGIAEKSGGMTPKLARMLIADILGMDEHTLPPLDPSIKPDIPFMLQIAEAVKNTANPEHQLAVKAIAKELIEAPAIGLNQLLALRDDLERQLASNKRRQRESA